MPLNGNTFLEYSRLQLAANFLGVRSRSFYNKCRGVTGTVCLKPIEKGYVGKLLTFRITDHEDRPCEWFPQLTPRRPVRRNHRLLTRPEKPTDLHVVTKYEELRAFLSPDRE